MGNRKRNTDVLDGMNTNKKVHGGFGGTHAQTIQYKDRSSVAFLPRISIMTSFHSKIAQHIIELELAELSKRNPSLGYHPDTQKPITWSMLVGSPESPSDSFDDPSSRIQSRLKCSHPNPLFPDDLPTRIPSRPSSDLPSRAPKSGDGPRAERTIDPVAIIGAGVAGLRVAMMLKHLGIPYVVFEASERYGGRVYTHHFKKEEGESASSQNYFDVGAMRFPDNAANARTFELFEELGITKDGGEGGKLLPYHLGTDENILLFNGGKHLHLPAEVN